MVATLVVALKRHERSAFEQLLAQHGAKLYPVAFSLLDQPQDAEEVLQETWLRVCQKIHTFDKHAALATWLYRIVVNAALTHVRARTRRPEVHQESTGAVYAVTQASPWKGSAWALPHCSEDVYVQAK